MMTGSVTAGRGLRGMMVKVLPLGPGMLNVIVWTPEAALASVITWRSDPGPLSFVLVTTKPAWRNACENSDVLPDGSVAVAVMMEPTSGVVVVKVKATLPRESV